MGNRRCGVTVSWPHVSLHCPGDHTYSHTQQFTKIICVIATLTSQREQSRVAGLDPKLPVVSGGFPPPKFAIRSNRWLGVKATPQLIPGPEPRHSMLNE